MDGYRTVFIGIFCTMIGLILSALYREATRDFDRREGHIKEIRESDKEGISEVTYTFETFEGIELERKSMVSDQFLDSLEYDEVTVLYKKSRIFGENSYIDAGKGEHKKKYSALGTCSTLLILAGVILLSLTFIPE